MTFIRLNRGGRADYDLDFSSCQKLGGLRQKLERSIDIIRSYDGVARTLRDVSGDLYQKDRMTKGKYDYMENTLKEQLFIAKGHERKLQIVLRSCDFSVQMVSDILDFAIWKVGASLTWMILQLFQLLSLRNDMVTHENGSFLKEMIGNSTVETKTIAWLSRQTCADARGTKITTLISMAYAPAAVIAVHSPTRINPQAT